MSAIINPYPFAGGAVKGGGGLGVDKGPFSALTSQTTCSFVHLPWIHLSDSPESKPVCEKVEKTEKREEEYIFFIWITN